jgi:hypothetical protein
MLGLATELIRYAFRTDKKSGEHWHLDPATAERATQVLGVYLHPESPEIIICEGDFGNLTQVLTERQGE